MGFFNDGIRSATRKAINRAGHAATDVGDTMPAFRETLNTANETFNRADGFISSLDGIEGRLATKIEKAGENVSSTSASVANIAKIGAGFAAFKCLSDFGVSWYRAIKLTGIASDARNDFKKLADNTSKTEDEIVNVLKNTSGDLKSSAGRFTEDIHKMGQNFGHMTESLSQSSNVSSESVAHISQDFHQTSRCFMVTCFALTTSALAASMIYLQNSSCYDDQESMLCVAPLKSMAATTIAAGFVALRVLMPNRVQHQINDDFLIPEEGINKNVEWTQEELDSIEDVNFDVFNFIEAKRKLDEKKWEKQELEWLLSKNKNIFLKVILSEDCTILDYLDNN